MNRTVGRYVGRAVKGVVMALGLVTALPPYRLTAQTAQRAVAITNATIVPVVGQRIPRGTVVIENGRISAVGASVTVPAGAQVIDASGLFVYPGLIDAGTQLGLTEITEQGAPGPTDLRELGDFNPHDDALTAVNPFSELISTTRVNGITTAITSPQGNQISGTAALIDLTGWTPREMAELPRAGMVMTYPQVAGGRRGGGGGGFGQQNADQAQQRVQQEVRALRDYLANAKAYAEIHQHTDSTNRPDVNLAMEAMIPVMTGHAPAIFDVETADQIRGVLQLADSFGIKVILRGASYAWELADELAARHVPVIVGPTTELPGPTDPYDMIYANPGVLVRAGVTIAFRTNSASDARNVAYNAALATAYGLDPEEAIRALTINPARMFGVDDRLGSIEVNKVANLIVTTGDPLDVRTTCRYVFIRGQNMPFDDMQTREYERWRNRPRPTAAPGN